MEPAKIDASISSVTDCGEHFAIACTFFGPEPTTLTIKKHEGLDIKDGDGITCFVNLEDENLKLLEKVDLFRRGEQYAQAKLEL